VPIVGVGVIVGVFVNVAVGVFVGVKVGVIVGVATFGYVAMVRCHLSVRTRISGAVVVLEKTTVKSL
jgi:hypothetical protein